MRRINQPFLDTDRYVRQQLGDETEAESRRARRADRAARGSTGELVVRANGVTLTGTVRVLDFLGGATIDGGIITVPAGAGGAYTDEQVRDVMGVALVAGANVTITPNDVADTITIAATAGAGVGAPTTATYITQTPDGGLSAEQALSTLATGVVKVTSGTGVLSTAVGADLPSHTHAAADTTSGQFAIARLASGTPDGSKFIRDDGVLAAPAGVGGVGAPTTATYITQTPDLTLASEQALSTLTTGILKSTTATGVLSIAVGADLPAHTHTNDHVAATVLDTGSIDLTLTGQQISAAAIFGTTGGTVAQGDDARLSDARTPTAHVHAAADVTSGTFAVARVGTGSGVATTYLDGTGAFTTPAGGGGAAFNETIQINTWLQQTNTTTSTVMTSGLTYFHYIGRAQAAATIVTAIYKVTVIAAGAITWAEVALFKGTPVAFGNASLTRLGLASIAGVVTVNGTKATAISLITAIAAGDDLWLAIGGVAATTQFQIRGGMAEELQFGVFQTAAVRPSLAASPQATTLAGAAVVPGRVGIRF